MARHPDFDILNLIANSDPDGWDHRMPTDIDKDIFRSEMIVRYGSKVWNTYRNTNWWDFGQDVI